MSSATEKRPLNTMFIITSMPVGGAETLLVNMMRRFDKDRIHPSVCCLKDKDQLGEVISSEFPVYEHLIQHKFDVAVIKRLRSLLVRERVDAVITVGAGDKMFWGRLAARYAKIPVVLSALHSTGWPDGVGTLNRLLTGITSGFIAVANSHGRHLIDVEGFPTEKVFVIPNGIDTRKFQFDQRARIQWRNEFAIPADAPVVGIVAALRPEKNHTLFVESARRVLEHFPDAHFVIVGRGNQQSVIDAKVNEMGIASNVHLPGCTMDIPGVLSMMDLFALTSDNEASPVSIMEAMSCQRPIVATNVGSVNESVIHNLTGLLVPPGDRSAMVSAWCQILGDEKRAKEMGIAARQHIVAKSSLHRMTDGYTELIERLFAGDSAARFNPAAGSPSVAKIAAEANT